MDKELDSSNSQRLFSRKNIRKVWLNVHLTIALTVGFVFVILGLTGSFNVFHWELEEMGLPEVKHEQFMQPLDLDAIMQKIRIRHPQRKGRWLLFMPGYERDYVWAVYPKPEENAGELYAPLRMQINPYIGDIAGEHYWGKTLWTLIYELHASLLTGYFFSAEIGKIGYDTVSFLGLLFMISTLTGLYLWWPNPGKLKQALTYKDNASFTRFNFDLHKISGFYSLVILFMIAFTGFSFAYEDYIKPVVALCSDVKALHFQEPEGLTSYPDDTTQAISVMAAVSIADKVFPYAELRWLATPDGPEGVYAIEKKQPGEANRRRPRSKVWIDQYTGDVLAVEDPELFTTGETFFNLMCPLHNGEAFGLPGRILWCFIGFIPLVLYITGIIRWLQKRKAHKLKTAKIRKAA